jgi:hypothetical protein
MLHRNAWTGMKVEEVASLADSTKRGRELRSWIDNVIVPILVQKILEERRQRSVSELANKAIQSSPNWE